MAATKRHLLSAFKLSRKLTILAAGILAILGVSGTAAYVFVGPGDLASSIGGKPGGHCKTIYHVEFKRAGERRLLYVIQSDDVESQSRIHTGIRIASFLAETKHADLITVQVSDMRGPAERVDLRGAAIGVEIVHAPDPRRTAATSRPWEVRFADGPATNAGLFFGERMDLSLADIEKVVTTIATPNGCDGDTEKPAELVKGKAGEGNPVDEGGHGAPAEAPAAPSGH